MIAYIPRERNYYSQAEYKTKFEQHVKTERLQQLYEAALSDLKQTQTNGSLDNIELKLGDKVKMVNLKIPIMYIIGDNQGGDSICGRWIYYGKNAKRISCMCNAGPQELQSPKIGSCTKLLMQDVMTKVEQDDEMYLENIYQARHWISWFELDYGGNPEGIFTAACPPEALHALENGIFLHILQQFFKVTLKKPICSLLDEHVSSWNKYPKQHYMQTHSIEGYPRMFYTSGISGLTDIKADDKVGIIFCLVIALLQFEGKHIMLDIACIEPDSFYKMLYIFELLLCYQEWLKQSVYWKQNDIATYHNVQKAIEKLLLDIIRLFPRTTGNKWAIAKIHEQLHVAENIQYFGAHNNVHTGPQEHNHIKNTKKTSKQVQRRKETLDWQLGLRLTDKYMINAAYNKINSPDVILVCDESLTTNESTTILPHACKFSFKINQLNDTMHVEYNWSSKTKSKIPLSHGIIESIIQQFPDQAFNQTVFCYTEMKIGENMYRVDLDYRHCNSWHDNVLVAWKRVQRIKDDKKKKGRHSLPNLNQEEVVELVPASLLLFFRFEGNCKFYSCIHSCGYKHKQLSVLSVLWMKEFNNLKKPKFTNMEIEQHCQGNTQNEPKYQIVECDAIQDHCLLIPYHKSNIYFIHIIHPDKWADKFHPIA